jgi:hypothetical protein
MLHLFSFKTPTKWADLSEEGDADLWLPTKLATEALEMRNGVKCVKSISIMIITIFSRCNIYK